MKNLSLSSFPLFGKNAFFFIFRGEGIKHPKIKIPKYIFMSYIIRGYINGLYHMKCLNWCIYKWLKSLELHNSTMAQYDRNVILHYSIPVSLSLFCQVNFLARFLHSEQNCKNLANLLILEQAYYFNCTRNVLDFKKKEWLGL